MPLVLADRVKETTTTTGTGTITLDGASTGFQSFSVIGNGNTTYYTIAGQGTNEWEVGIGTYTSSGTTLSRDTVLASSAGAPTKTTFSAGTKDVFVTYTAARSVNVDGTSIDTFGMGATQGDILYASATDNFVRLAKDTNATRYLANTGTTNNPAWAQVNLANGVTGTLPVANGGTGQTTYTDGQLLIGNTTGNTLTKATLTGTSNQITVTNGSGSITLATPQNIGTASSVQFGSFGVGTAASGTTGEIRATNNVTAYYSSDRALKENIRDIPDALIKVCAIGGKLFDWTDDYIQKRGGADGYFVQKADFGVIAQDVAAQFPVAVRKREDGTLAVDYEKMCALAFAAIAELCAEVESLKKGR